MKEAQGSTSAESASLDDIAAAQAEKPIESDPIAAADSISAETEEIQAPRVTEEGLAQKGFQTQEPYQRGERGDRGDLRQRRDSRVPRGPPRDNDARATGEKKEPKATVYVGNLFFDITAEDLRTEMSKVGTVLNARLIFDSRGLSRG